MQELKVIGVENGALLAASEDGDRFRIAIDEVLQSKLRQNQTEASEAPKLSPREVQAHIRSGMSADDVAAVTGAPLDYVRRFEGPVVAEREYMISCALSVPVHTAIDPDPVGDDANFGGVIRDRLTSLGASNERWASWKEPGAGWIIKLSFTADDIDHDARWGFEPKKNALSPIGSEAIALSQQGELKGSLIPRLRAVGAETSNSDVSRFDSGAFTFKESLADEILSDTAPIEPIPYSRTLGTSDAVFKAAIKRAAEPSVSMSDTADLLESLRRRRGEREAASVGDASGQHQSPPAPDASETRRRTDAPAAAHTETDNHAPSTPEDDGSTEARPASESAANAKEPAAKTTAAPNIWATQAARAQGRTAGATTKRGRASMPSWDEIVFGARTDDDLA